MSQNILYISYDGMTDSLGQSQVLPYLAGLVEKGYSVTLLSCEKPERSAYFDTVKHYCSVHHINWHPVAYTRKPPILSTIKDIKVLKKKALALHKEISFSLVHCRSYVAAGIGQWLQKEVGLPFIFDMRGFWANERVDGGLWRLSNPLYRQAFKYYKKKEVEFLRDAAAIVSLTHAGKEEIERWAVPHAPIHVIPCCVDSKLFDPEALNPSQLAIVKRKADLPNNKLVLGYVGSLGTWYQLDEMLYFFKYWLKAFPESIFFFVTNEPLQMIQDAAQDNMIDLEKIRVIAASRNDMPYYISLMDFGVFFIKNVYSKLASSPVKQGELMAMGVPVICNAGVGDSDYIVQKYKSGELVHNLDEAGFTDAIRRLKEGIAHPSDIRHGALDYFDLGKGIAAYEHVYKSILDSDYAQQREDIEALSAEL